VRNATPARSFPGSTQPSATARRLAEAGVLATALIWSANFVVAKAAIGVLGPFTFTGARYAVASVTLLAILWLRERRLRPPPGQLAILLGLGLLGFGGYQVLWTVGLTRISAGDSALIVAASPVLTALLASAVGMDQLTLPKALGALIAFAGVAVVVAAGQGLALGASLTGDALTLGAATLWAIYTVGGTRVLRRVDPLQATTWTVIGGSLVLVPLGIGEVVLRPASGASLEVVAGIVYSGALAAAIANVFVFNAIRYVGPTRATAMQLLVPAGAVVLGAAFLHEPLGPGQLVGGLVIVLGVGLTRRASIVPSRVSARLVRARP
jgi:drug/metabolite transporter (DMT)-like permease